MFEVIKLNSDEITFNYENDSYFGGGDIEDLMKDSILNNDNFTRTYARINNDSVIDLEQRSSWTHNKKFIVNAVEMDEYFEKKNIIENNQEFELLKYEKGDFFNIHLDYKINSNHKYTCLVFLNDKNNKYEGGRLILNDKDKIFDINVNSTNTDDCLMVIFSLDLYHKIEEVTKGVRYVFKKTLFQYNDDDCDLVDEQPGGLADGYNDNNYLDNQETDCSMDLRY